MNKSFENRFGMVYTNEHGSKLSSRQKMRFAMRRFRALGLNEEEPHRYENYARIVNQHAGSADDLLKRLKEHIDKQGEYIKRGQHYMPHDINHYRGLLEDEDLTTQEKDAFNRLKSRASELPRLQEKVQKEKYAW